MPSCPHLFAAGAAEVFSRPCAELSLVGVPLAYGFPSAWQQVDLPGPQVCVGLLCHLLPAQWLATYSLLQVWSAVVPALHICFVECGCPSAIVDWSGN